MVVGGGRRRGKVDGVGNVVPAALTAAAAAVVLEAVPSPSAAGTEARVPAAARTAPTVERRRARATRRGPTLCASRHAESRARHTAS